MTAPQDDVPQANVKLDPHIATAARATARAVCGIQLG
jgi:hypothetical protein